MKILNRTYRGFTLIEAVVASVIAASGLLIGFSVIGTQWRITRVTDEETYITRILESRMEEIRDLTYDELIAQTPESSFNPKPVESIFGEAVNPNAANSDYNLELRGASGKIYIQTMEANLRKVTVELTWKHGGMDKTRRRVLTSYISRNGINRR